jgi:hypothetical protein
VVAVVGPLLQPHFARRDDGDFRHRKHTIQQNEEQQYQNVHWDQKKTGWLKLTGKAGFVLPCLDE